MLLLTSCKDEKETPAATTNNGDFMTWTQNGQVYKATDVSAFTYKSIPIISINGGVVLPGQGLSERTLTISVPNSLTKPGTYSLPQSSTPADVVSGQLVLVVPGISTPVDYNTVYGPAAVNGTVTLTEYDVQAQRLVGTFEFTAESSGSASPLTQTVTAGSFRLTKLEAAPGGL